MNSEKTICKKVLVKRRNASICRISRRLKAKFQKNRRDFANTLENFVFWGDEKNSLFAPLKSEIFRYF